MDRPQLSALSTATLLFASVLAAPASAAVFVCTGADVDPVGCLRAAIDAANRNGEADTIQVDGVFTLVDPVDFTDGPSGLPSIASAIDVVGTGVATTRIERAVAAPPFRIFHVGPTGALVVDGLTIAGGFAPPSFGAGEPDAGGGFYSHGALTIRGCVVADNVAAGDGGGIRSGGDELAGAAPATLTIESSVVEHNFAGFDGGGLENDDFSEATVTGSTIRCNFASFSGGGVLNDNTPTASEALTVADSFVLSNRASTGGGVSNDGGGNLLLSRVTVAGNEAWFDGGGVANEVQPFTVPERGDARIESSTIRDNRAFDDGGGVQNAGTLAIVNTTVGRNLALDGGGGLRNGTVFDPGDVVLAQTTFAANEAVRQGGGLRSRFGTIELRNSIAATNRAARDGDDCDETELLGPAGLVYQGANVVAEPGSCPPGAFVDAPDPFVGFVPGGAPGTGHFPLAPATAAADAGDPAVCEAFDQLGRPRTLDPLCDLGAVELYAAPPPAPPADETCGRLVSHRCAANHQVAVGRRCRAQLACFAKSAAKPEADPSEPRLAACLDAADRRFAAEFGASFRVTLGFRCAIPDAPLSFAGSPVWDPIEQLEAGILTGADPASKPDRKLRNRLLKSAAKACSGLLDASARDALAPDPAKRLRREGKLRAKLEKRCGKAVAKAPYAGPDCATIWQDLKTFATDVEGSSLLP